MLILENEMVKMGLLWQNSW